MKKANIITINDFSSDEDQQIIALDDAFLESISAGMDVPVIHTNADNLPNQDSAEL
jgi:hypothetical protein